LKDAYTLISVGWLSS